MISLYRHFDAKGALLYIGISNNPMYRLKAHRTQSHWSDSIVRVEIEHFPCRPSALAAEAAAIKAEKPRHNQRHVPKPKPKFRPSPEQRGKICGLWQSALEGKHILKMASEVAGQKVSRDQVRNLCGPRFKGDGGSR